jgi:hypothetical protein
MACRLSSSLLQSSFKQLQQADRLGMLDLTIQQYCHALSRSVSNTNSRHLWKFGQLQICLNLIQTTRDSIVKADEAIRALEQGLWRLASQLQHDGRTNRLRSVNRKRSNNRRQSSPSSISPKKFDYEGALLPAENPQSAHSSWTDSQSNETVDDNWNFTDMVSDTPWDELWNVITDGVGA